MSFWLSNYQRIVEALQASGKPIGGVRDFLVAADKPARIILRHDVDRMAAKAIHLAKIEARLCVRSTYYFRASSSGAFPTAAVTAIAALGHEVGYHYEDLSFCQGDEEAALERFLRNMNTLRQLAPCTTVSMHGAPLSKFHNQDLLTADDLRRAQLLGDAVAGIEPFSPYYLTDTGGGWLAQANLRDRVGCAWPSDCLPTHIAAFQQFVADAERPLYISTHPERWSDSWPGYLRSKTADMLTNSIKVALRRLRPARHG